MYCILNTETYSRTKIWARMRRLVANSRGGYGPIILMIISLPTLTMFCTRKDLNLTTQHHRNTRAELARPFNTMIDVRSKLRSRKWKLSSSLALHRAFELTSDKMSGSARRGTTKCKDLDTCSQPRTSVVGKAQSIRLFIRFLTDFQGLALVQSLRISDLPRSLHLGRPIGALSVEGQITSSVLVAQSHFLRGIEMKEWRNLLHFKATQANVKQMRSYLREQLGFKLIFKNDLIK